MIIASNIDYLMHDFAASIGALKPGMVTVVGVPSDESSSFMRGAALAPARICEALHSGAMNLCAENGIDLGTETRWRDLGDLGLGQGAVAFQ